jgi:hypothetical protein
MRPSGPIFGNLPRRPFGGRVCRHVDPGKLAPSQPDNDQKVQQVKADGRDHEQVHGRDLRQMVAQKCAPALTRRAAVCAGHVLGYGRLSDRKAELEQLATKAWRPARTMKNERLDILFSWISSL